MKKVVKIPVFYLFAIILILISAQVSLSGEGVFSQEKLDENLRIDWGKIFKPSIPVVEIMVRGSVMYFSLFILLRVFLKRQVGTLGITDLLVIVLLADAAQNGMAGGYKSVLDGVLLVIVIIFWAYFLDFIGYTFPKLQRIIFAPPLLIVDDGKLIYRNMRKEFLTETEVRSQLRAQGIEDMEIVKMAFVEPDGRVSVVRKDGGKTGSKGKKINF